MSEHKKTITAIAFNPQNPQLLASCGADRKVIVWDCDQQKVIAQLENTRDTPIGVGWCFHGNETVTFTSRRGQFFVWHYLNPSTKLTTVKEATGFSSDVFIFRWHPQNTGKLVLGHRNGSISLCNAGKIFYMKYWGCVEVIDTQKRTKIQLFSLKYMYSETYAQLNMFY